MVTPCQHGNVKSKCKECRKEYDKQRYLKNKEAFLDYCHKRYWGKRAEILEKKRQYKIKNKNTIAQRKQEYRKSHPEERRAQNIISSGNRRGKIKYLLNDFCELCPDEDRRTKSLEHAHIDYEYPELYITACRQCHVNADLTKQEVRALQ